MSGTPTSGSAIVLGIVCAVLISAGLVAVGARFGPSRPSGSGDPGVVAVYAQTRFGPVRLVSGEPRELPRPQDFAFQFTCEGAGPRVVRVEWVSEPRTEVLHEEKLDCPANMESLGYVLTLGDDAPNDVVLRAVVESPHDRVRAHSYTIRLVGRE